MWRPISVTFDAAFAIFQKHLLKTVDNRCAPDLSHHMLDAQPGAQVSICRVEGLVQNVEVIDCFEVRDLHLEDLPKRDVNLEGHFGVQLSQEVVDKLAIDGESFD